MANRIFLHYLALVGAIALGAILRFWHLDWKPLWLDEVFTALFSLGRSYNDVPLDVVFHLDVLEQIFTLKPGVSCPQIAHTLATQSTHPPLFFCLMHSWFSWVSPVSSGWVWSLRSLPALFGVMAIAAVYCLNARAFSPRAGLMAAAVMAVSPFAVYLSQEARHYTLPLLLITLALLGLIQIQQDLFDTQQLRLSVWVGWVIVNIIGLYVHYFFILAFIAEVGTLLGLMYWQRRTLPRNSWAAVSLAVISIVASFIPWLPVMLGHFNRSETSWLPPPNNISPLFQTLSSWLLIVIALPVENQPLWIAVPSGLLMVLFGCWVGWQVFRGLRHIAIFKKPNSSPLAYRDCTKKITNLRISLLMLLSFTFGVLLQFFAIVYLLGKDLTVVPRYNFVYYPSLCALLGASLNAGQNIESKIPSSTTSNCLPYPSGKGLFYKVLPTSLIVLLVGVLSCFFVASDLAFQKPFYPQRVAQNMNQEPSVPLMVVVAYKDYQDVALGLSFASALEKVRSDTLHTDFAFFKRSLGYEFVWAQLSHLPPPATSKLNLWVVAPGLRRRDYPPHLALSKQTTCTFDPTQHYRIGVPYQLYRCN